LGHDVGAACGWYCLTGLLFEVLFEPKVLKELELLMKFKVLLEPKIDWTIEQLRQPR
jgi:hypothetical protein